MGWQINIQKIKNKKRQPIALLKTISIFEYQITKQSGATLLNTAKNKMTLITTIEIDEIDTEVSIEFTNHFGEIEVLKVTDAETGDAICPELPNEVYRDMLEMWADSLADKYGSKYKTEY